MFATTWQLAIAADQSQTGPLDPTPNSTDQALTPNEAYSMGGNPSNPTENIDAYENNRRAMQEIKMQPKYSFSLLGQYKAFPTVDWRVRPYDGQIANPKFFALILQFDRVILHKAGVWSLGAELGTYGTVGKDQFEKAYPALVTVGATLGYKFHYWYNQWFVPFLQAGISEGRYNFLFFSDRVKGWKLLPRFDAGILFYLNFLDRNSSGDLYGNYGVLRTYLTLAYTHGMDLNKSKDFELKDGHLRFGLKFEF